MHMEHMRISIIIMMANVDADAAMIMKSMNTIMNIITMANVDADMTTTMKATNIIMITIINVDAAVDITIMIMRDTIMPMMYLQVGEKRQSVLTQKKRSEISSRLWKKMDLLEISFEQKVWLQVLMENGSISIWFRVSMK